MATKKTTQKRKQARRPSDHRTPAAAAASEAQLRERSFLISDIVEIKSLILIDCAASRSPDLPEEGKRKARIKVTSVGHAYCQEHRRLQVHVGFGLTLVSADSSDQKIEMNASFVIDYALKGTAEFSDREFDAFAGLNGVHNAWPFWRELVHNLTARMGIRPLMIPVHRVG